jgi:hypothetical protein
VTAGCGSKKAQPGPSQPASAGWPTYSKSVVSGKIFGKAWKATVAVLRPFQGDNKLVSLDLYAQAGGDVCQNAMSSDQPMASVALPANLSKTEYVADMSQPGSGNPMMFIDMKTAKNVMAEKTKIKVNQLSDSGLNVSVYAFGLDTDGSVSEINGRIDVLDCSKAVDFSVWSELEGWYDLKSLDGQTAPGTHTAVFQMTSQTFYDRANSRWVQTLVLPLYDFVGENSSSNYEFGVMEGLGVSTYKESGDQKIYTYKYKGPIYTDGEDITLDLSIQVVKTEADMQVTYTLEVPNHIKRTSHSFVVGKL